MARLYTWSYSIAIVGWPRKGMTSGETALCHWGRLRRSSQLEVICSLHSLRLDSQVFLEEKPEWHISVSTSPSLTVFFPRCWLYSEAFPKSWQKCLPKASDLGFNSLATLKEVSFTNILRSILSVWFVVLSSLPEPGWKVSPSSPARTESKNGVVPQGTAGYCHQIKVTGE